MTSLLLRARGLERPLRVDLVPDRAVLVGRSPDPRRLSVAIPARETVCVTVSSEHVSLNHAVVWMSHDGVWALDLASRNGTWARLGSGRPVALQGAEIQIDLAGAEVSDTSTERLPSDPGWTGPQDFSRALARSLSEWLTRSGVEAEVTDASLAPRDAPARLHLATGGDLVVLPRQGATLDVRLPALLTTAAAFVEEQNALFDQELGHPDDFVLRSPRFREAHRKVWDAAVRGRRLMLLGASGTGKDRLAECYHRHSARADGPFKAVNCALMEKEMIWVQLFGAARGSYTGSVRDVPGAVEAAHGGTLFLDEVGELSPRMQAALLRFLDRRGEYERLGDPRTRRADVALVCATNADLRGAVARGEFREDLWYRFAGTVVEVPPLRERPEDIAAFLDARLVAPSLSARRALSLDAFELVLRHPWSGNFRELENFAQRLPTAARAAAIDAATVREALSEGAARPSVSDTSASAPPPPTSWERVLGDACATWVEDHDGAAPESFGHLKDFVDNHLKPAFVAHACEVADGNVPVAGVNYSAVGRKLDIGDGTTVKRWLERYFSRRRG